MSTQKLQLQIAEKIASQLFDEVLKSKIVTAGATEQQINTAIYQLALSKFGIQKYWHKRIVRCGANTLYPYDENPPNLTLKADDILFFDFGPIVEEWEADFGRTFVLGTDAYKLKLQRDIEKAWWEAKAWFHKQETLSGATYYKYIVNLAKLYGWEFGGEIAGHLIGHFPHEKLEKDNYGLYIHPENHNDLFALDGQGKKRDWILEIHFVDREKQIGGFFEQLLT